MNNSYILNDNYIKFFKDKLKDCLIIVAFYPLIKSCEILDKLNNDKAKI